MCLVVCLVVCLFVLQRVVIVEDFLPSFFTGSL